MFGFIPGVQEAFTACTTVVKGVAATVTRPFSTKTSDKLFESIGNDWSECSESSMLMGTINAAICNIQGDKEESSRIINKVGNNILGSVDATPILGHIKGAVHLYSGDTEQALNSFTKATRSVVVLGAAAATGGTLGPVVGGLTAVGTGIVYDQTARALMCKYKGEQWCIDFEEEMRKLGEDPGAAMDFFIQTGMDALSGVSAAKAAKALKQAKTIRAKKDAMKTRIGNRATEDTIQLAREFEEILKSVDPQQDNHTATLAKDNATGNTAIGHNRPFREAQRIHDFENNPNTNYLSREHAQRHGESNHSVLQVENRHITPRHHDRNPNVCAMHDAIDKLNAQPGELDTRQVTMVTVKKIDGDIKAVGRCNNCLEYRNVVGDVPTDNIHNMSVPTGCWKERMSTSKSHNRNKHVIVTMRDKYNDREKKKDEHNEHLE